MNGISEQVFSIIYARACIYSIVEILSYNSGLNNLVKLKATFHDS
jgi:hypothetical protein